MKAGLDEKKRCFGNKPGQELYAQYHDTEWGIPVHDDQKLFEMLILEGAQAGLSWEIVLKKREGYRKAFYNFDPKKVAIMRDEEKVFITLLKPLPKRDFSYQRKLVRISPQRNILNKIIKSHRRMLQKISPIP